MTVVKITTDTGNSWTARVNGASAEIVRYFLGNVFNTGAIEDSLETCVLVEIGDQIWGLSDLPAVTL